MEGGELRASALGRGRERRAKDVACRALDLVATAALVLLLAPLLLLIALIVKLDSPGPVLFRQQRVGRGRRTFLVAKFRTMQHGADHDVHRDYMLALIESGTPAPKLAGDARVTRFGAFLRRTSLDELPQLWNVLRGEMSLVGPRPPIPYEVDHYPPHWFERFLVKPGVTGLWQVSGRSEVSLEEMIELDVDYARRRSVLLNVWILLRTIPAVLSQRGAG
jgi:lipopolysaccharide/colanic/teichoic acid biosynthesis glycosyltransferase